MENIYPSFEVHYHDLGHFLRQRGEIISKARIDARNKGRLRQLDLERECIP